MTTPVAPTFLPWLRIGLAAHIDETAVNGLAPHDSTTATVSVRLHATGDSERTEDIPSPPVRLYGPGDVIGIASTEVLRCEPAAGTGDAEPNYFAHIEFGSPDLPWRFTPAAPGGRDRLQPWLALVVVEDRAGVLLEDRGAQARPVLHIDDAALELPDLAQCWAWAHVQADCPLDDGVAAALGSQPSLFRARLMCPRRLAAGRSWIACVVPTFEAGRRAALGEAVGPDLGLAWSPTDRDVSLPVFYSWRFSTGVSGDFESLVKKLIPRELPGTVGRRDMDVSDPGDPLPSRAGLLLTYRGALVTPGGDERPWPQTHRSATIGAFRDLLNRQLRRDSHNGAYSALRDDPVVGAPAYGAVQAHQRKLPADTDGARALPAPPGGLAPIDRDDLELPGGHGPVLPGGGYEPVPPQGPGWFTTLNTEPAHRVVAAIGASIVRHDQEALMAAAWRHATEHRAVNRMLSRARLGWEVARVTQSKLDAFADAGLVQLAGPALARLPSSAGGTLSAALAGSSIPAGLVSGAMRRKCRTVAGLSPVAAVTTPVLADPVGFTAAWRTVRSPAGADLQSSSGAGPATSPGGRMRAVGRAAVVATKPAVDLAAQIRVALQPANAIATMVGSLVAGLPGQTVPSRVWARPRFTNPLYVRLRALALDTLVPGVGEIPPDTIGLLETNPAFVEAFLAGFNHELGREFRWREYPAQLDDTWGRHFWDTGPGGPADIKAISQWGSLAHLGDNRPPATPAADLVLLIKGALPRRYPDLRVYAVEAKWGPKGNRREKEGGVVCMPVLTGRLGADVHFYGFALSAEVARGSTDLAEHPGYFLVMEQRPESIRFGLDVAAARFRGVAPGSWPDLSWAHLVTAGELLPTFVSASGPSWLLNAGELTGNGGPDSWGDDAAAMARITLQRPVRMLTHASSMLPEGTL